MGIHRRTNALRQSILIPDSTMSSIRITPPRLVGHRIAASENDPIDAALYEYFLAGNGLFVRARRLEFSICLPLSVQRVSGLPPASVGISWTQSKIHASLWQEILLHAQQTHPYPNFKEEIYLIYWKRSLLQWQWRPAGREHTTVSTIADDTLPEYTDCCIELHTHPPGASSFSRADDRDELGKFRIFAILVDVHDQPKIRFRCGVYEHLIPIPSIWVGEMPDEILDLNEMEALVEMLS